MVVDRYDGDELNSREIRLICDATENKAHRLVPGGKEKVFEVGPTGGKGIESSCSSICI